VEENSFGLPLPALTGGVHFKVNDGIARRESQVRRRAVEHRL